MCGDSVDRLSKALIPDVSTAEVDDFIVASIRQENPVDQAHG